MKIGTNGYRGKGRTPSGRYEVVPGEKQDKETAEASSLPMVEARRLPKEMYNFYKMDQYETSSLEEARHKDFDIWLQDFDEQVRLRRIVEFTSINTQIGAK